jgi:phospholipid-binding lipoprotein MlaA
VRRCDTGPGGHGIAWPLAVVLAVVLGGCGSVSGLLKSDDGPSGGRPPVVAAEPAPVADTASPRVETVAVGADTPAPSADTAVVSGEARDTEGAEPVTTEQAADTTADETTLALLSLADDGEVTLLDRAPADLHVSALAQRAQDPGDVVDEEYDPWEPFNEKMFEFNRRVDRWVLKPIARAYMFVMPEPWQVLIANGFSNINFVPRLVNSLLQGKWGGAGRELSRFLINSTAGIGGLFDPAKDFWGIEKSREDFGQTLGVWGSPPGPYLVLPFMEPLTVRDGIGKAVDGFMDPLSYFLPFIWDRLGMKVGDIVNDRALNYDLFQGFEESVIDMYSAVRHGYLQRRQQLIRE